ncbi:hypothetical protein EON67_08660 [archaeon]|nr:MAG: hypothetical protein EON67_08660 [archaeon]
MAHTCLLSRACRAPVCSSNYLCRFRDLTITTVALDDVMAQPDKPDNASMIVDHETRSLRDTRVLLSRNSIRDCMQFVEENDHPRLWRLLAETALEKLDLISAEKAFISSSDYAGIQFVKRLRLLHDRNKQRAEVLLRLRRFDDAEKLYRFVVRARARVRTYK